MLLYCFIAYDIIIKKESDILRVTKLEVDLNKFRENIYSIKKYVGNKKIMPVIKANAYGTYINKRLDIVNEFDIVAVAFVLEGIELRKLGYEKDIFVLNQPSLEELRDILEYNLIVGISDFGFLEYLDNIGKDIRVHLEIETGMNRTGIKLSELDEFIDKVNKNKHIIVEGIYSHLSSADCDLIYTENQYNLFKSAVNILNNRIKTIKYVHISASNGIINFSDDISNLVRPGIMIYGYLNNNKVDVEPICKLKTKITFIKECNRGESIGYSRGFIATKKIKVATIPIGYADGLNRILSNKGSVIINNKLCKIIGNICMDSCMIDVSNVINVKIGDDVYIWDNDLITVDSIAEISNTINYEILSTVSNRVCREFIE